MSNSVPAVRVIPRDLSWWAKQIFGASSFCLLHAKSTETTMPEVRNHAVATHVRGAVQIEKSLARSEEKVVWKVGLIPE
jgi:hypothetical protein